MEFDLNSPVMKVSVRDRFKLVTAAHAAVLVFYRHVKISNPLLPISAGFVLHTLTLLTLGNIMIPLFALVLCGENQFLFLRSKQSCFRVSDDVFLMCQLE